MDEDRSASETVGIVLLVAIAVVISAVVLAFALGVLGPGLGGDRVTAEFTVDRVGHDIVVEHRGGERIRRASLVVLVRNDTQSVGYDLSDPLDLAAPLGDGDAYFEPAEAAVISDTPTGSVDVQLVHQPSRRILVSTTLRVPAVPPRANQQPVASFTTESTASGTTLNASRSRDRDGEIVSYRWDVEDDGEIDYRGRRVENASISRGTAVVLIVRDDDNATDTAKKRVGGRSRGVAAGPVVDLPATTSPTPTYSSPKLLPSRSSAFIRRSAPRAWLAS